MDDIIFETVKEKKKFIVLNRRWERLISKILKRTRGSKFLEFFEMSMMYLLLTIHIVSYIQKCIKLFCNH